MNRIERFQADSPQELDYKIQKYCQEKRMNPLSISVCTTEGYSSRTAWAFVVLEEMEGEG